LIGSRTSAGGECDRSSDECSRRLPKDPTSTQNETLALNWISRPGVMAMVMVPN